MKKENFIALRHELKEYKYFIYKLMIGVINYD